MRRMSTRGPGQRYRRSQTHGLGRQYWSVVRGAGPEGSGVKARVGADYPLFPMVSSLFGTVVGAMSRQGLFRR